MMKKQNMTGLPQRVADENFPISRGDWPQSRNRRDYETLFTQRLPNTENEISRIEFDIPLDSIIVDAGMGDGNALAEFKRNDTTTIGFTLNEHNEKNDDNIDTICFSPIPNGENARKLFGVLCGKVQQVFGVFGPCTYAENPVLALAFLGLLLKRDGKANIIISSVKNENIDISPIGHALTRQKIKDFFKKHLDLDLSICRTIVDSQVSDGQCYDFIMTIHRNKNANEIKYKLDDICDLAIREIGIPTNIPKKTNWGKFKDKYTIQGKRYNDSLIEWKSFITSLDISHCIKNTNIIFEIKFDDITAMKLFNCIFTEFFIDRPNPEWQLDIEDGTARLTYRSKNISNKMQLEDGNPERQLNYSWKRALNDLAISELPQFDILKKSVLDRNSDHVYYDSGHTITFFKKECLNGNKDQDMQQQQKNNF